MKRRISLVLPVFFLLLFPLNAYAYLDPGTGSVILQGILGALAALTVVLKLYWHRILKFLRIRKSEKSMKCSDTTESK